MDPKVPLTWEQKEAVQKFVREHGARGWKQAVRRLWSRAIAFEPHEQLVYGLRNSHGPTWLVKVRVDVHGWVKS